MFLDGILQDSVFRFVFLFLNFLVLGQNRMQHFGREAVSLWGSEGSLAGHEAALAPCSTSLPICRGGGGHESHSLCFTVYHVSPLELRGGLGFWFLTYFVFYCVALV